MATLSQKTDEIAALESLKKDLAKFEMKQAKATKADVKVKIAAKIKGIREQIKAGKTKEKDVSAKQLANSLLRSRKKFLEMSKKDFNGVIRQLSKKPEYSFLKGMSRTEVINDINRKAKPVGWRFKGRNNYKTPTKEQVRKGRANGTVYYENRPNRSDVSQARQLAKGGGVNETFAEWKKRNGLRVEKDENLFVVIDNNGLKLMKAKSKVDLAKMMKNLYMFAKYEGTSKEAMYAKGGKMQQGYNDRMDESLGMRHRGHHSQSHKDRRDEAKGMNKGMGNRAYQSVGSMDKMAKGGKVRVLKDIDNSYHKDNPKKGDILIVRDLNKDINYWETEDGKIPESVIAWFKGRGNEYMLGEEVEFDEFFLEKGGSTYNDGGEIKPTSYQESDNGIYEVKMSDGEIVIVDFSLEYFEEQRNKKDIFAQAKRNYEPSTYAEGGEIKPTSYQESDNGIYEVKMSDGEIVIVDFSLEYFEEQRNKKDIFAQAKRNYEPSTYAEGGALKPLPNDNKGLPKLPKEVRNRMGYMAKGGSLKGGEEEEYIDPIRQAHIDYETEKSERLYNSDAWVDAQRNAEGFAKGGSLKGHGLAIGDEIVNVYRDDIYVLNRGVVYMVDLSSGKRTMTKMSKDDAISTFKDGGEVKEDPQVIRYYFEDDGYEYEKGGSTYNDDPNDLYGAFEKGGEVDINDIEIPVHYTMFEEEMYEYGKGGNTEQKYLVKRVFKNGSKSRVVDENLSEKEAQEMVQEDIENNPKGEYYMLVYTKMN